MQEPDQQARGGREDEEQQGETIGAPTLAGRLLAMVGRGRVRGDEHGK